MLWKEVKRWAKETGFEVTKKSDHYTWYKIDNEEISGTSSGMSKLVRSIFNHVTNNQWVEHQNIYEKM